MENNYKNTSQIETNYTKLDDVNFMVVCCAFATLLPV